MTRPVFNATLIGLWSFAVLAGMTSLWSYENAPADPGSPAGLWPSDTGIRLSSDRPTLVMLAHPQCACTRASIAELAKLAARFNGRFSAHVLFYKPKGFGKEWLEGQNWRSAGSIPGVQVWTDEDGVMARRFGAEASGHTLLYGPDGKLLFTGGITGSRGHEGDNAGTEAIGSLIRSGTSARRSTFVFGCSLTARRS